VPADGAFATKPELARQMLVRALDAGVSAAWVAADEVYGQSPGLRRELETRGVGCVLAIASSHRVAFGPESAAPTRSPPKFPKAHGSACRPGRARKAGAGMTGRSSRSTGTSPATGSC
jgi:SRSO17 transposase